ncbi:hypothetical protein SERLADRAFT_459929 [Serpula lacrymans var. lacrymans S7.9]|uniref:Uncharacterized protein n=1 Tax=Serpula lacrymans var. lacrymans (strain S7.9) TaxID=578457 RepID=F8NNQ4_SERL9|nr:uncharacterized protein SERLADRAFT_459929 [Serpula lacrymans var. lacrymans S7.9]EGO27096.1 hypothetical protein SERLADRAFT_459929 [Serpula lacrymans var. lacrymans S7.9]
MMPQARSQRQLSIPLVDHSFWWKCKSFLRYIVSCSSSLDPVERAELVSLAFGIYSYRQPFFRLGLRAKSNFPAPFCFSLIPSEAILPRSSRLCNVRRSSLYNVRGPGHFAFAPN